MLLLLQEKSMIKIRLKYCSCLELFTMSVHNLVQKIFLTNLTNVGLKNSKKNLRQRKHIVRTHWNSWSQRAIFFLNGFYRSDYSRWKIWGQVGRPGWSQWLHTTILQMIKLRSIKRSHILQISQVFYFSMRCFFHIHKWPRNVVI